MSFSVRRSVQWTHVERPPAMMCDSVQSVAHQSHSLNLDVQGFYRWSVPSAYAL
jgi:hypothetical protein